mmetsp:Transcript_20922/g.39132  ORF Transcript_20922/g.39132 Transcript_20922/m.39132 type:complete len:208 (-) Transcript_20922:204-827(-)
MIQYRPRLEHGPADDVLKVAQHPEVIRTKFRKKPDEKFFQIRHIGFFDVLLQGRHRGSDGISEHPVLCALVLAQDLELLRQLRDQALHLPPVRLGHENRHVIHLPQQPVIVEGKVLPVLPVRQDELLHRGLQCPGTFLLALVAVRDEVSDLADPSAVVGLAVRGAAGALEALGRGGGEGLEAARAATRLVRAVERRRERRRQGYAVA